MKPYRIKHIPTGLYYKPGEVNLTKNGKVYATANNAFSYYSHGSIPVSARRHSKLHLNTQNIINWNVDKYYSSRVSANIPINQFEKEEL